MKTRRHAKILEIIQNEAVDTQEDLLVRLRAEGFSVTQATVSRDIKELRLIKTLREDGRYHYTSLQSAGMANAVCAGMDTLHFKGIIGTLAGDDTFLCIAKDESFAVEMVAELKKIMKK